MVRQPRKLSTKAIRVRVLHEGTGSITENDIHLAAASDAIIIGFNVRPTVKVKELADGRGVDIRSYDVIYHALEDIEKAMKGMLEPTFEERVIGTAEVRETFQVPKIGTIAGCSVIDGKIERNARVRVLRDGVVVYTGKIGSLRRFKDDVKEVLTGFECGIGVENFNDIKIGDNLEAFVLDEVAGVPCNRRACPWNLISNCPDWAGRKLAAQAGGRGHQERADDTAAAKGEPTRGCRRSHLPGGGDPGSQAGQDLLHRAGAARPAVPRGKGMNRAKGFFRSHLAKILNMRYTPSCCFIFDESQRGGASASTPCFGRSTRSGTMNSPDQTVLGGGTGARGIFSWPPISIRMATPLGSLLGLAEILEGMGKRCFAIWRSRFRTSTAFSPAAPRCRPTWCRVRELPPRPGTISSALCLDCGDAGTVGRGTAGS